MYACQNGHADVAFLLLNRGVDVSQANADVGAVAQDGWTALVGAAWSGRVELVSLLLDARATVNVRSTRECEGVPMGSTPLFIAKMRGHTAIADLLKRHGAVLE